MAESTLARMGSETKLKKKINALIERITDKENDLENMKMQTQLLQEEIRLLEQEERKKCNPHTKQEEESKIERFLRDFCLVARRLIEDDAYIEYSYKTKNSEEFYKVKQEVFEEYICQVAKLDLKTFLHFCVDLRLVKSERNRRCLYNSAEIRVYYVNRIFVDMAAQREEDMEEFWES